MGLCGENLSVEAEEVEVQDWEGEEKAVDAVEHSSVPRNDVRAVLNLGGTLEQRFREVAELAEHAKKQRDQDDVEERKFPEKKVLQEDCCEDPPKQTAHGTLIRFLRADERRKERSSDSLAYKERRRVSHPNHYEEDHKPVQPQLVAEFETQRERRVEEKREIESAQQICHQAQRALAQIILPPHCGQETCEEYHSEHYRWRNPLFLKSGEKHPECRIAKPRLAVQSHRPDQPEILVEAEGAENPQCDQEVSRRRINYQCKDGRHENNS